MINAKTQATMEQNKIIVEGPPPMNMQQEEEEEVEENGISLIKILNGLKEFVQRGREKMAGFGGRMTRNSNQIKHFVSSPRCIVDTGRNFPRPD